DQGAKPRGGDRLDGRETAIVVIVVVGAVAVTVTVAVTIAAIAIAAGKLLVAAADVVLLDAPGLDLARLGFRLATCLGFGIGPFGGGGGRSGDGLFTLLLAGLAAGLLFGLGLGQAGIDARLGGLTGILPGGRIGRCRGLLSGSAVLDGGFGLL